MALVISDQFIKATQKTEDELRMDLAIFFYTELKMPPGKCGSFVNMTRMAFLEEIGKRKIAHHYEVADLKNDIKTLEMLNL